MPMTSRGVINTNPQSADGKPLPENLAQHMEPCDCDAHGPAPSGNMDVSDPDFSGAIGPLAPNADGTGVEDNALAGPLDTNPNGGNSGGALPSSDLL